MTPIQIPLLPDGDPVRIKILPVNQPIGDFFVGTISAQDLAFIAYADTRRKERREVEIYTGIQRELSKSRQQEIKQYITSHGATFPNAFIISIKGSDIISITNDEMLVNRTEKTASIIDGQHRLSGFTSENWNGFQQLIVTIFTDLPVEDQAMIFATINIKQTKVNSSLVFDLFELTTRRSPEKTAHDIAKALNSQVGSPFYREIKLLGRRDEEYKGSITQGTFIKELLPRICSNPEEIRSRLKQGKMLSPNDPENAKCIFWRFFAEEEDAAILKILLNFFGAVEDVFGGEWRDRGSPLGRTIGFTALMRTMTDIVKSALDEKDRRDAGGGKGPVRLDRAWFHEKLLPARAVAPFTFENYPASGAGQPKLYTTIATAIKENFGASELFA